MRASRTFGVHTDQRLGRNPAGRARLEYVVFMEGMHTLSLGSSQRREDADGFEDVDGF